jgi:hypothetical protein
MQRAFLLCGLSALIWAQEPNVCDIRKYGGAKGIQAAIDACTAMGGGTVYVPPGRYVTGELQLKDNVTLHLEAGATLVPSQAKEDYPKGPRAFLYSSGAKKIALTGRGTIDGEARYSWTPARRPDPEIAEEVEIAKAAGLDMRRSNHAGLGLFLVRFVNSTDVFVENVSLLNSQFWTLRLDGCERVRVRGVHIANDLEKGVNADGIDVVSTRDVVISDSVITTADDAIVLKTEDKPTENVVVTNCVLSSSSTPLMIGTETKADVRHVIFSNSVIRGSNKGIGINVQDGATVSDVMFVNLTMELDRRHWNWWGSAEMIRFLLKKRTPESRLGAIRDIVVENVRARARGTSVIAGQAGPIEGVTLRNIDLEMWAENTPDKRATHALVIENVKDLRMRDVRVRWAEDKIEPKWGSALVLRRIGHVELEGFEGRPGLPGGTAPVVLVEGADSGWMRGVVGTVAGVEGTKVKLEGR